MIGGLTLHASTNANNFFLYLSNLYLILSQLVLVLQHIINHFYTVWIVESKISGSKIGQQTLTFLSLHFNFGGALYSFLGFYILFLVSVLATTKIANCKQVYMHMLCVYMLWTLSTHQGRYQVSESLSVWRTWPWRLKSDLKSAGLWCPSGPARPVVALTGLWCLWSGLGRPVVTGAPARPLVPLTGLRCPWKDCGAPALWQA